MKYKLSASIGAMAVALTGVAKAQVDTITVTAQKREENVQDVPIAISAFDGQSLQERAITSVAGLSNITPNVSLDGGTPFSGDPAVISAYIRGIGQNDFNLAFEPGVAFYVDDQYYALLAGSVFDLLDIERVEVLRSPVVRETDPLYEPVARFIADHGLVLAARESFPDGEWMWAEVEVSVYVPPAVRNGVLAGTDLSMPWHTPAALTVSQ